MLFKGNDGGLTQYFLLEVVGGNPEYNEITKDFQALPNEISTMNDQVSRKLPQSNIIYHIYIELWTLC